VKREMGEKERERGGIGCEGKGRGKDRGIEGKEETVEGAGEEGRKRNICLVLDWALSTPLYVDQFWGSMHCGRVNQSVNQSKIQNSALCRQRIKDE